LSAGKDDSVADAARGGDDYLYELEPGRREALIELRALILAVVPDAVETMKYRMPTYEYGAGVLCAFASQKQYMSLYMETNAVAQHRQDLRGLSVGKSCIRFRKLEQLPLDVVKRMLVETEKRLRKD
jgi:uncharacterized protein YdhG (YjbR/CyaY superfamily)